MGMATCVPIREPTAFFRGRPVRYRLPCVAFKSRLLRANEFGMALSSYLHEIGHMFGGDQTAAFGYVLSDFMQITLSEVQLVADYQKRWNAVDDSMNQSG